MSFVSSRYVDNYGHEGSRSDRRVANKPITVDIGGIRYETVDWSLGGFAIRHPAPALIDNPLILGAIETDGQREAFRAKSVRFEEGESVLACAFLELTPSCFNLLEGHLTDRTIRERARKMASWRHPN